MKAQPSGELEHQKKGRQPHQTQTSKARMADQSDPDLRFGGSYFNDFTVGSHDLR
jgi:hypothetical protein